MNKKEFKENWKLFIESFKLKISFLYILFYDVLFYVIFFSLFLPFSFLMDKKMSMIDSDILSNIDPAAIADITAAQNFIYTWVIGIILLAVITLFAFTLTRALIWNHLLKKRFDIKKYLKFNLLVLLLAFLVGIVYILLRIIASLMINLFLKISVSFALILSLILYLLIFTAVIYFTSLAYINYTKTGKIFNSFSKTFSLIKTKFKKIYLSYLFIFLVSIIIVLAAMVRWLLPASIQSYFNYALVLSFLAWMRIYIVKLIKIK